MKSCSQCIHNKSTGRIYEEKKPLGDIKTYEQCQKKHPIPLSIKDAAKCKDYKWAGDGKDYTVHVKAKGGCAAYTEVRKRGS